MGHADTRILRRYQDVVPELKREAASKMGELLGGVTVAKVLPLRLLPEVAETFPLVIA